MKASPNKQSPVKRSPAKRTKHSAKKNNVNNENSLSPIKLRSLDAAPSTSTEVKASLCNSFEATLEQTAKPANLLEYRKETKWSLQSKQDDIKDILEIGQHLMSFGKFISSKVLGSHLTLTNKSDREQIFEVSVDRETKHYELSTKELFCEYVESELPFPVSSSPALNSEAVHKCLFIENPRSKNLEKSVMFKLAAKSCA